MLSFFSKKKQSPETPPEDNTIKGPSEENGEDFIVVENQHSGGPAPFHNPAPMMPLYPYPPASYGIQSSNTPQTPIPYILGIPFNLSPQLCTRTSFEVTQMEVDGILALMTKQMHFENNEEEPPLDNAFDDEKTPRCFKWSPDSTKLLLNSRFRRSSAFNNRTTTKKKLWDSIAADMYQIGGYRVSGLLCDLKFRNMIHTYKKNRQKENKGQVSLIIWEYYQQFKESFGDKYDGNRRNNLTDSMLLDETTMGALNESSDKINDIQNENSLTLDKNQEDNEAADIQSHVSSKRKIREISCCEDEDCKKIDLPHPESVASHPLTEDERQECTAFGNSIGCQLQNIKDPYTRALTKLKMQKIIFLAQTGRLNLNDEQL